MLAMKEQEVLGVFSLGAGDVELGDSEVDSELRSTTSATASSISTSTNASTISPTTTWFYY